MDENMIIKYWGVRGSIPSPLTTEQIRKKEIALIEKIIEDGGTVNLFGEEEPNKELIKEYIVESLPLSLSGTYGGDTTCIEIQAKDSPLIMIDAGTGARAFGNALLGRLFSGNNLNPLNSNKDTGRDIHLFLTHYHWDHIQGFPFFAPAFIPGDNKVNIHFYGKKDVRGRLSDVLSGQQQYPNFPVEWQHMPCKKDYTDLGRFETSTIKLGSTSVKYQELTHPDSVFAYLFEVNGKKFVCATDTEHKDSPDPRLVKLAKDADILYYDAQYTPEEYKDPKMPRFDWGHSTYEWAIRNALFANVKTVVLGHHDPPRYDSEIEKLEEKAEAFKNDEIIFQKESGLLKRENDLQLVMAYQGLEQRL